MSLFPSGVMLNTQPVSAVSSPDQLPITDVIVSCGGEVINAPTEVHCKPSVDDTAFCNDHHIECNIITTFVSMDDAARLNEDPIYPFSFLPSPEMDYPVSQCVSAERTTTSGMFRVTNPTNGVVFGVVPGEFLQGYDPIMDCFL